VVPTGNDPGRPLGDVFGRHPPRCERCEFARQRQTIIAANPEFQERELIKLASLASAMGGETFEVRAEIWAPVHHVHQSAASRFCSRQPDR
jgi:hypothetical protein